MILIDSKTLVYRMTAKAKIEIANFFKNQILLEYIDSFFNQIPNVIYYIL